MEIEKTLHVQKRVQCGKGASGRLRAQKLIPGIYYNSAGENIPVQVATLPLEKLYSEVGFTTVFNLEIEDEDGKTNLHPALIWAVQKHPYKKRFVHIDYYGVDLNKEIKVDVPLEFVGTAKGVKQGGVLETYRETVRLSAKPLEMPQKIVVDVTDLDLNSTVNVENLSLPANVSAVFEQNYAICSVLMPSQDDGTAGGEEAGAEGTETTTGSAS